jgi:hypothetical protein
MHPRKSMVVPSAISLDVGYNSDRFAVAQLAATLPTRGYPRDYLSRRRMAMAGQIKRMLDEIIRQRAKDSPIVASTTKTKLTLKGFNPDKFTAASEDIPGMIAKLRGIAAEMGVKL